MPKKVGTCQYESWEEKICDRDALPDSKHHHCICHEQNEEKDLGKFNEEIEKIMQDKKTKFYDFRGFYFPKNFDFGNIYQHLEKRRTFKKNVNFEGATFQEANFVSATFQDADFEYATFQGRAHFWCAKFQEADFEYATFQEADFERTTFQEADFEGATFKDEFLFTDIKGIPSFNFRNTRFSDSTIIKNVNLNKALFNFSRAELVDFTGAQFPQKIYEETLLEKDELNEEEERYRPKNWEEVSTIYRKLKQAHQRYGDYGKAGEFYYREMECKKKELRTKGFSLDWFKSFCYSFLKHSCGYGEKPLRVLRNWLILIFGFAIAYFFSKSISFSGTSMLEDIFQSIYFSIITFTTLGHGDMQPISNWGRGLVMTEAILGAIFIALFIFVFGRKMMR